MSDEALETTGTDGVTEESVETPIARETPSEPIQAPDYVRQVLYPQRTGQPPTTTATVPAPAPQHTTTTSEIKWATADDWLNDPGRAAEMDRAALRAESGQHLTSLKSQNQQLQDRLAKIEESNRTAQEKRVASSIAKADSHLGHLYKVFSGNPHFTGNPEFQMKANALVTGFLEEAVTRAYQSGDDELLKQFYAPSFAANVLGLIQSEFSDLSPAPTPLRVDGGYQASGTASPHSAAGGASSLTKEDLDEIKSTPGLTVEAVLKARKASAERGA